MKPIDAFKLPKPVKITGRTSSITNAFVNGIIPSIMPTNSEVEEVLKILDLDANDLRCSYCGDVATEWDHLRPIVENKRPTGFISDIKNLVPSCGKCNQSKGNKHWETWMYGDAKLSPKSKGVIDIDERRKRLIEFEKSGNVQPINFGEIVGKEDWQQHWNNCKELHQKMKEFQKLSDRIKTKLAAEFGK